MAWWFARDDRRFSERLRTAGFPPDPGLSLNELNLGAAREPITDRSESERQIRDST
jgi:hypothetical protein